MMLKSSNLHILMRRLLEQLQATSVIVLWLMQENFKETSFKEIDGPRAQSEELLLKLVVNSQPRYL